MQTDEGEEEDRDREEDHDHDHDHDDDPDTDGIDHEGGGNDSDDGDTERQAPPAIDRLVDFVDPVHDCKVNTTCHGKTNIFKENCQAFFCSLACLTIRALQDGTDINIQAYDNFVLSLDQSNESWWTSTEAMKMVKSFRLDAASQWDGKQRLPDDVVEYGREFLESKPHETKTQTGERIWKVHKSNKDFINNRINKAWPDKPESGINEAQDLYEVLQKIWPKVSRDMTANSISSQISRLTNPKKKRLSAEEANFLEKYQGDDADTKARKLRMIERVADAKPFDRMWRPKCWLVFIAFGVLGYIQTYSDFYSGRRKKMSSPNRNANSLGKKTRRNQDPPKDPEAAEKGKGKGSAQVKPTVSHELTQKTEKPDLLQLTDREIAGRYSELELGKDVYSPDHLKRLQRELLESLAEERKLLEKAKLDLRSSREDVRSSPSTPTPKRRQPLRSQPTPPSPLNALYSSTSSRSSSSASGSRKRRLDT